MSLLFLDGFGHYQTSDLPRKWTSVTTGASGTAVAVQSSVVRFGPNALMYTGATGGGASACFITKALAATASWVIGFAFRYNQPPSAAVVICTLRDAASVQCDLRLNVDGTLSVTRAGTALTSGTSVTALSSGTWYYLEWKVTIANSIAANSCKVRINAVDAITVATGQDTQATANATANDVCLGCTNTLLATGSAFRAYFADFFCANQSGAVNNDFIGDQRVQVILPDGAGNSTQWTPSAGANWQCVDENPPTDDTDYVSSAILTQKDTYTLAALAVDPTTIAGIQTNLLMRKDDAGARLLTPVVRTGGADFDGTSVSVGDNYAFDCQIRETNPNTTAAWTASEVNGLEAGQKLVL